MFTNNGSGWKPCVPWKPAKKRKKKSAYYWRSFKPARGYYKLHRVLFDGRQGQA